MSDPQSSLPSDRLRLLWLFTFMITLLALTGVVAVAAPAAPESASAHEGGELGIFTNPLLPRAQDPQITYHAGNYYYCESSPEGVFLRVAPHFSLFGQAEPRRVWAPPAEGPFSKNIWAPELHIIDGRPHIYVAADDGDNANHRMGVLVAETDDVLGPYRLASILDTQGWAIDGTVLTLENGSRYFIWSGWPGKTDGQQNLYISRMKSPTELQGRRVLIKRPDQPWERLGMPICEGPQILRRNGRTFLIYSASGSWTADYCLGMLVLEPGADPMVPANWKLAGQVFARNDHAYGVGHCDFVLSPDGNNDWIVYHAKTLPTDGWGDREVRAQPFRWDVNGWPKFGHPVDPALPLVMHDVPTEFLARAATTMRAQSAERRALEVGAEVESLSPALN